MNGDKKFREIYDKFGERYGALIYYQRASRSFRGKTKLSSGYLLDEVVRSETVNSDADYKNFNKYA
jgi:hypothetical protein